MDIQDTTREKILKAAREVFVEKGYDGARMHEIAARAGVNKAMIYYYYSSKDALFESILKESLKRFFDSFFELPDIVDMEAEKLITAFIHAHIDFLAQNPYLPKMIIREIHGSNPVTYKVIQECFDLELGKIIHKFEQKISNASASGEIRSVDAIQTMWNVAAMNLFHFIMKPVINVFFMNKKIDENELLTKRKQAITDLVLNGLLPR
ncbi:TetR/AcrR family transcriptional regulator [candidate division KSB1 bacterium]|nr:TetR/AcrR family transcriptional regulator [candidate division KSB1 bacterium]